MKQRRMTTIQLEKRVVKELRQAKEYPEQTYNVLIEKMVKAFRQAMRVDQFDKFLLEAQRAKMKELWENADDEAWEHA